MSDYMDKAFDRAAAFQKLWKDSFAKVASVWTAPSDDLRNR